MPALTPPTAMLQRLMNLELTPATWQMWCYATLTVVMLMAVEADLRERRIPNTLVLLALLAGLTLNTFGPANGREGLFSYFPGALGLGTALMGALTGLGLLLPLYAMRAMGAGDVKLLAALGAFAGPQETLSLLLAILAAGGVLALLRMAVKRNAGVVLRNVALAMGSLGRRDAPRFDPATQSADRMPFALAFAAGLLAYGGWRHAGGMPFMVF